MSCSRPLLATSRPLFIDDRAFVCHDFPTLELWKQWSQTLGLIENENKMEIVSKSPALRQRLLAHPQYRTRLVPHTRVLGLDYTQAPHLCPTTQHRLDQATHRAERLRRAHLSRRTSGILWRTRVITKASWGWLFRRPTTRQQDQINRLHAQIFPGQRMGSRALRAMLEGNAANFTFMAHYQSWQAFARTITHQSLTSPWHHTLNQWLCSLDWSPARPGTWTHPHLPTLNARGPPKCQEHLLRESWRRYLHKQYLQSNRRETPTLQRWQYTEQQCQIARTLYDEPTSTPHHRAVLIGAPHSTAYYQKRQYGSVGTCPFCHTNQVPNWHHCCWECPHFAPRPPTPNTTPALRLGWPVPHDSIQVARRRLDHMARVRSVCFHHDEGFHRPRRSPT